MSRKSNLAQIWAERISACQASGSNVKSWCRDFNLDSFTPKCLFIFCNKNKTSF